MQTYFHTNTYTRVHSTEMSRSILVDKRRLLALTRVKTSAANVKCHRKCAFLGNRAHSHARKRILNADTATTLPKSIK